MDNYQTKVSTHTFIAYTNLKDLNLKQLFNEVEILDPLVYLRYRHNEKGHKKKQKSNKTQKQKNFLNCISFSFVYDNKSLNLKLFKNGVIQITGCKSLEDCKTALIFIWDIISDHHVDDLKIYLVSVMRNIYLKLGINMDREKLSKIILSEINGVICPSIGGFVGKQFLFPIETIKDMPVYKFTIKRDEENKKFLSEENEITYEHFISIFSSLNIDIHNKLSIENTTKKKITISVFQSGGVLCSGIHEKYQTEVVEMFLQLINNVKEEITIKSKEVCSLKDYLSPIHW